MKRTTFNGKRTSHTIRRVPPYMSPFKIPINDSISWENPFVNQNMDDELWKLSTEDVERIYGRVPKTTKQYTEERRMFKNGRILYYDDSAHYVQSNCRKCDKKCGDPRLRTRRGKQKKSWNKTKNCRSPTIDVKTDFCVI